MRYVTAILVAVPWAALSWVLAIALFAPPSRGIGAGLGMVIAIGVVVVAASLGLLGARHHHRRHRTRWLVPFLLAVLASCPLLFALTL